MATIAATIAAAHGQKCKIGDFMPDFAAEPPPPPPPQTDAEQQAVARRTTQVVKKIKGT